MPRRTKPEPLLKKHLCRKRIIREREVSWDVEQKSFSVAMLISEM